MSTKTIYKRIALVAVAALGAGLMSVAPANAATDPFTYAAGKNTDTAVVETYGSVDTSIIRQIAGPNESITVAATQQGIGSYENLLVTTTGGVSILTAASRTYQEGTVEALPFTSGTSGNTTTTYTPYCALDTAVRTASGSSVTGSRFNSTANLTTVLVPQGLMGSGTITFTSSFSLAPVTGKPNGDLGSACGAWVANTPTPATITVPTTAAGTINVTVAGYEADDQSTTNLVAFTIIVSPAASREYSYTKTEDLDLLGSGYSVEGRLAGDGAIYSPASAGQQAFRADFQQYRSDGTDVATPFAASWEVSVTGPAVLTNWDLLGNSINPLVGVSTLSVPAGTSDYFSFRVASNGVAGTSVVTVKVKGVVVQTWNVKFYGKATKITVVPLLTIGKAGGGATGSISSPDTTPRASYIDGDTEDRASESNNPALGVLVTDANGTAIPNTGVGNSGRWSSTNLSVISEVCDDDFTEDGSGRFTAGVGPWVTHCDFETSVNAASGQSADVTATLVLSDGTILTSLPQKLTVGGSPKTVTVAFDKSPATYALGASAKIIVTAKDASGNPVFDGAQPLAIDGYLKSNLNSGTWVWGNSQVTKGGSVTVEDVYAPAIAGTWTLTGKDVNGVALTASATVSAGSDITALTTLVNSLIAKMNALNKLVVKIQKKVKAK